MEQNLEEKKKSIFETNNGISIFGINIPFWLIILVLVLFIGYMWMENKTPSDVLSLTFEEPLSMSSIPMFDETISIERF